MNKRKINRHAEMKWPEFATLVKKVNFAILPVGAIEQHGPHLPLNTDVLIADYLGQRVAEITGGLLMNTLQYTPSFSLRLFPGTVRVSDQTFANTLVEIIESIALHGIKTVYALVGHIGAADACKDAERQLLLTSKARMVNLVLPGVNEAVAEHCQSKRWHPSILHADEYETSCVLFLRPDLVDMSKAVKEYPPHDLLFGPISMPWNEFTKSGVVGDATLATAERGKAMLEHIAAKSVELIRLHQESLKKKKKNLAV
jgi:creatinine amidohydrolase